MGEIKDSEIASQNALIVDFAFQAKEMLDFMRKFLIHIEQMEFEFDNSV